jgi:hypothetical protein
MKNVKILATVILATLSLASCSDDDDLPEVINEEEVITTMTITLVPDNDGASVILKTQDLDGDGPDEPVVTSGKLVAGVTYDGSIELLNELETPAEDITLEVIEEDLDHQIFYTIASDLGVTIDNVNLDSEGNLLGTEFKLTAGAASSGLLTFTLRHEPTKPNTGLEDAGGETDIEVSFNVEVE